MGDKPFGEFLIMPKGDCFRMTRTLRKKIINNPQWILDMGIYKREDCKYIFMQAEEVLATSLYLGYNMAPTIMEDIKDTPFSCLKELWISQNQIESIEMVCRMRLPHLEEIWLRQNVIRTIKNFTKSHWPALNTISLYGNCILDMDRVTVILSPLLNTIWVEYEMHEKVQGQDLSWIAKIQSVFIENLCFGSNERIFQAKTSKTLEQKFFSKKAKFYFKKQ